MNEKEVLQTCQGWCSQREHCIAELNEKLAKYDLTDSTKESITKQLLDDGYIDEQRYARCFARDKARFNGWGPRKIRFHLSVKRINSEAIDNAIAEIDPEIFEDSLERALTSRMKGADKKDRQRLKAALLRLGESRGFEYDNIFRITDKLLKADS